VARRLGRADRRDPSGRRPVTPPADGLAALMSAVRLGALSGLDDHALRIVVEGDVDALWSEWWGADPGIAMSIGAASGLRDDALASLGDCLALAWKRSPRPRTHDGGGVQSLAAALRTADESEITRLGILVTVAASGPMRPRVGEPDYDVRLAVADAAYHVALAGRTVVERPAGGLYSDLADSYTRSYVSAMEPLWPPPAACALGVRMCAHVVSGDISGRSLEVAALVRKRLPPDRVLAEVVGGLTG